MGSALGGIVSGLGEKYQADAAKNAAKYNRRMAKVIGREKRDRLRTAQRIERGKNIVKIGAGHRRGGGVRASSVSVVETLANNAANVERRMLMLRREEFIAVERFTAQAKAADMASMMAIAGSVATTVGTALSMGLDSGGGSSTGKPAAPAGGGASAGGYVPSSGGGVGGSYSVWSTNAWNNRNR